MMIPACKTFVLKAAIDNVPAGATGQLNRVDDYVALVFDDPHTDLVYDIHDTGPEVWAAIQPYRPRKVLGLTRVAIAAIVLWSFLIGAMSMPQPNFAKEATENIAHISTYLLGFDP